LFTKPTPPFISLSGGFGGKKQNIMKKERQYRSNQGRSPEKVAEIYKLLTLAIGLGTIVILAYSIYNLI